MKKTALLLSIVTCVSIFFAAQTNVQTGEKRIFVVELEKNNFILLEPMVVKFSYTLMPGESLPRILETTSIKVTSQEGIREFPRLTTHITSAPTETLPLQPRNHTMLGLQGEAQLDPKSRSISVEETVYDTNVFFPKPGKYLVKFSYKDAESQELEIYIHEPNGIDKKAYDFLSQYKDPLRFGWVFETENGVRLLSNFVEAYSESVFHDPAAYQLGLILFLRGDLDISKTILMKLKSSENSTISKNATDLIKDVENNILIREKNKTDRP